MQKYFYFSLFYQILYRLVNWFFTFTKKKSQIFLITTVTITTPPYNIYSERKECQKYPDFKLCDKNYEAEITDERFELELKKYIISVDGEEKKEEVKDEKADFISKFLRAYKSNLVLSVLLTIALFGGIGVLIYYFVIRRRKNNVDPSCK